MHGSVMKFKGTTFTTNDCCICLILTFHLSLHPIHSCMQQSRESVKITPRCCAAGHKKEFDRLTSFSIRRLHISVIFMQNKPHAYIKINTSTARHICRRLNLKNYRSVIALNIFSQHFTPYTSTPLGSINGKMLYITPLIELPRREHAHHFISAIYGFQLKAHIIRHQRHNRLKISSLVNRE